MLLEIFIHQTTYFLVYVQLLCFLLLFGKYHAKWRDISLYLPLLLIQCILASTLDTSALDTPNFICFVLSLLSFSYLMFLLNHIAKAKNKTQANSTRDFIYMLAFIALLFVVMVSKFVILHDFMKIIQTL